jgi:GH35 family endo-1,4-beta-xylanase
MTNNLDLSRRSFLKAAAAGTLAFRGLEMPAIAATPSMKDAYKGIFLVGTALDFRNATEFNDTELGIIKSQFNAMTPENSMKPAEVHPQENSWNWTRPDTLVRFCEENNITVFGHTLAWHAQTNRWFFDGADRNVALERLKSHILTLVGHFRGKIAGWDVVNEAINDNGPATTENLRNSQWFQIIGPDYLTQAFRFAREADPKVALHYNDYNIEGGNKHQSSLLLLKRLLSEGAPLDTVGIQGHWSVSGMNAQKLEQIDQAIENYKKLGLKVAITELDLTMTGSGGGQLGGPRRGDGGAAPVTPEALQAQADAYAKLFALFIKHRDVINRVTFWGLNDRRSWKARDNPLVFDGQNQAKPALQAIVDVGLKASATAKP